MRKSGEEIERRVRLAVYEGFVERARAPTLNEIAEALEAPPESVQAAMRRLAKGRKLVLDSSEAIRMAMPFSAVATPFQVRADERKWWANCAWDALGIPALLGRDVEIDAECGDCGEPLELAVASGAVTGEGLVHFIVPPSRWWEDIRFT